MLITCMVPCPRLRPTHCDWKKIGINEVTVPNHSLVVGMCLHLFAGVLHLGVGLVLLLDTGVVGQEALAVLSLLVGLDERAAPAAARERNVDEAAALEVVLFADVLALHGHGDPVQAEAARAAEEQALRNMSVSSLMSTFAQ